MFLIFIERRCTNAMQLAARQCWLDEVGRVHRAFAFASAHKRMHFVDEQYDVALGLLDLVEHALQPLFKLAAIFCPCNQRAHIEREQFAVLQAIGHIAIGDAQCQPLGNRGFANAGLADQHGIILGTAGEDLDGTADFFVAADDGVKFTRARNFRQVAGKFLERVIAVFGASGVSRTATPQVVDCGVKALGSDGCCCQRLACGGGLGERECKQQAFNGDIAVARLLRDLFGGIEHAHRVIVEARCLLRAAAGYRRHLCQGRVGLAQGGCRIPASGLDQARRHALLIFKQSFQEMLGPNPLMAHANGDGLCALQKTLGPVSEFFEVHALIPKWR